MPAKKTTTTSKPKKSAKPASRAPASARGARSDRSAQFRAVFGAIRGMLETLAPQLSVMIDKPGHYYLNTVSPSWRGKPLYFASVQIKKNYVSYHLFPVYMNPELLKSVSPALKKRMQGKACFNFAEPDMMLFTELAVLTTAGFREYDRKGLL